MYHNAQSYISPLLYTFLALYSCWNSCWIARLSGKNCIFLLLWSPTWEI